MQTRWTTERATGFPRLEKLCEAYQAQPVLLIAVVDDPEGPVMTVVGAEPDLDRDAALMVLRQAVALVSQPEGSLRSTI